MIIKLNIVKIFAVSIFPIIALIFYSNVSNYKEKIILEYLTQDNRCPSDIDCFNDYYKALEYAKKNEKPLFINFTGIAFLSTREFENYFRKNISNDYVFVSLHVDNLTELPLNEQITVEYNGKTKRLKTYGNKWAYFEYINFEQVSQPYFVLLSPSEQLLTKPMGYSSRKDYEKVFNDFLACGIIAFKTTQTTSDK